MATVEEIEENKKSRIQKSSFMIEDILSTQAKALSGKLLSGKSAVYICMFLALNEHATIQNQFQQNLAAINMLSRQPRVPMISPGLHALTPGEESICIFHQCKKSIYPI